MKSINLQTAIIVAIFVAVALAFGAYPSFGGTFNSQSGTASPTSDRGVVRYTFFTATTTNATSTNIVAAYDADGRYDDGSLDVRGAKKITFTFARGGATGANTGLTRFEVEGYDGANWVDLNRLITNDVSGTATSTFSTTVAATTTSLVSVDLSQHSVQKVRCIAVEFTDGDHSCSALAEF